MYGDTNEIILYGSNKLFLRTGIFGTLFGWCSSYFDISTRIPVANRTYKMSVFYTIIIEDFIHIFQ